MKASCLLSMMVFVLALTAHPSPASDWPQFMRDSTHTGDAANESLHLPLGLVAQIKLDDAVMTSPAVVGGRVFVVDQMGTAYCIDPKAGRIVWKTAPEGAKAMGSNTSSPCVTGNRVCYGTTAGCFHILDARDGARIRTLKIGTSIISSPTFANGRIYFQALDAVLRCLDLEGNEQWKWDHYARYQEPAAVTKAEAKHRGHPGSYDRPHYGGGEVAVWGTKIVTGFGWDLACLEDKGQHTELVWCRRAPSGKDGIAPMSSSISSEWVYTAGMGADGFLQLLRVSLPDGMVPKEGVPAIPVAWTTAAVRGSLVTIRNCGWLRDEIQTFEVGKGRTTLWQDPKMATPVISSHALARDHLAVTTLRGEFLLLDLLPKSKGQPFRFRTPHGKPIASSPAIADGCVFFGCDDGYLYVLGAGGSLEPRKEEKLSVSQPRSTVSPATNKTYGWTSLAANPQGTNFVADPELKPPLRLRWATRAYGHFKTPCIATEDGDVLSVTFQRTVTCQEQATGRLRWRGRLPLDAEEWASSGSLLAAGGRVYVPVPNNRANEQKGRFFCLDQKTGDVFWSAEIGRKNVFTRGGPVLAAGKVAYSHARKGKPPKSVVQAWEAATGVPAWEVEISGSAENSFGVTDGRTFYFSAANQYNGARPKGQPAETVAIEARTGKVLWRSSEAASGLQLSLREGRLYLYDSCVTCISARDGSVIWKGLQDACGRYLSLGPDFYVLRGYAGHAWHGNLADGAGIRFKERGAQLGGDDHACGPVALTPNLSVNVTVSGLHVRDGKAGALLWRSPGFAPRGCVNPSLANGRVFWPSAASGMVFCWEPVFPTK